MVLSRPKVEEIFSSFRNLKALIIGDVMLDCYWWGKVSRISPEAPVPVVSVGRTESRLGGAGNVALNIHALGAVPFLCSVVGDDEHGSQLVSLIKAQGFSTNGIIKSASRNTTVKTRIIGNNHQMLRVDSETEEALAAQDSNNLYEKIEELVKREQPHVIIFEDYNKGTLTASLIEKVTALAAEHKIPVTVDPKKNNFAAYKNATLFKPNLKELREGLKTDIDNNNILAIERAALDLKTKISAEKILVTLSENGMLIMSDAGCHLEPAHIRNIADVSGAGDTVISVASLCVALNLPDKIIARLSNIAGGLVCESVGVVPVDREKLIKEALKEN